MAEKITMTLEKIDAITSKLTQQLIKKNEDYGSASFDLGLNGNMVHLWDKVSRYRTLVERKTTTGNSPNYESIEDTLMDIMGYAVIGLIILEGDSQATVSD